MSKLYAGIDKIICKYVTSESTTPGGLIIPSSQVNEGIVSTLVVADEEGDGGYTAVFVRRNAGEITINGEKYFILDKKNVLAFVEETAKEETGKVIPGTWSC